MDESFNLSFSQGFILHMYQHKFWNFGTLIFYLVYITFYNHIHLWMRYYSYFLSVNQSAPALQSSPKA